MQPKYQQILRCQFSLYRESCVAASEASNTAVGLSPEEMHLLDLNPPKERVDQFWIRLVSSCSFSWSTCNFQANGESDCGASEGSTRGGFWAKPEILRTCESHSSAIIMFTRFSLGNFHFFSGTGRPFEGCVHSPPQADG